MKTILRGILLLLLFVGGWFLLSQIDYMERWGIKKMSEKSEAKLSEFVKENIERTEEVIKDEAIKNKVDSILKKVLRDNHFEDDQVKLMLINKTEVNAFALPSGYIIIHSGLIARCETPEALAGVMAHELGHIKLNHIRKKLIKELGLAVVISSTGGGSGEAARQITKTLSSSAYDRSLEQDADKEAVKYLINAEIDPEPLATFFYLLSADQPDFMSDFAWLSTHPASEDRAEEIITLKNNYEFDGQFKSPLSDAGWQDLQNSLNDL